MEVGEAQSCISMIILIVGIGTKSRMKKLGRCNPKPRLRRLLVEAWVLGLGSWGRFRKLGLPSN